MTGDEKENKTERVTVLISPTEVEAIDDWGFKNRIRTRSEAIRRLCQIGIVFDERKSALTALSKEVADDAAAIFPMLVESVENPNRENSVLVADAVAKLASSAIKLAFKANFAARVATGLKGADDLEAEVDNSNDIRQLVKDGKISL